MPSLLAFSTLAFLYVMQFVNVSSYNQHGKRKSDRMVKGGKWRWQQCFNAASQGRIMIIIIPKWRRDKKWIRMYQTFCIQSCFLQYTKYNILLLCTLYIHISHISSDYPFKWRNIQNIQTLSIRSLLQTVSIAMNPK